MITDIPDWLLRAKIIGRIKAFNVEPFHQNRLTARKLSERDGEQC
jgi:hypothetical protein